MRMRLLFTTAFLAALAVSPRAHANPMDVTLSRFGLINGTSDRCPVGDPTMTTVTVDCVANEANWQMLMTQLTMSVATPVLNPARTVGYRHFYLAFESNTTNIQNASLAPGRDYWQLGTDGNRSADFDEGNRFSEGRNSWMRGTIRKGLPFGLELASSFGRLLRTNNWLWGFELKWALLEGFRKGGAGWLPDVAVRGSVVGVTGTRGFTLTVPSADVTVSKGFVLGRVVELSPYFAGQMVWTIADSAVVDVTPGTTVDNDQGANLVVFSKMRVWHPRIAAGFQVKYRRFVVNAAWRYDVGNPARGLDLPTGFSMFRQWAVDVGVGVAY